MKRLLIFLSLVCQYFCVSAKDAEQVQIICNNVPAEVVCSKDADKGILIAVNNLKEDLKRVCGNYPSANKRKIIVGTVNDKLIKKHLPKNLQADLQGKTEQYYLYADKNLVIAGSDKRGTIYGIYELSKRMGVSPWYYWADVPVQHKSDFSIEKGAYTEGEPAVRYRGLFLNDEAPCLTTWVKNTFGTDYGDHRFYEKVFELILRLKGNFLWPAMWGWAFYADDEQNSKVADEMGIIMGTSHHEPMARNHQEYARNRQKWGAWDYVTNKENLNRFFREGIERAKNTEDLITIGMRGDGDTSMGGKEGHDDEAVSQDEKVMGILKDVVSNQRKIISEVTGKPAEERPQVWALYKEVQKYYDKGLRVPDDVTILLSDDNWGDVRSLPTAEERNRKGGWGIYYHVDYVGAPRNTKWLNVTPFANMWEQLQLTYDYGVDKIWVLNVGDLKPMEYPISMFLDMAWNPKRYNAHNLIEKAREWCAMQLGENQADEAARLLNLYTFYNGRITPEMLNARTYNVETGEWKQVRDDYNKLADEALTQYNSLPQEYRDTYKQLLLYPIQAMANLYDMYYSAAIGDSVQVDKDFQRDQELMDDYNKIMANGKWNGMMIQNHIGYKIWQEPQKQEKPKVLKPQPTISIKSEKGDYLAIDAEDFTNKTDLSDAKWTVIPYLGKTKSGVALMPYTVCPKGSELKYKLNHATADSVTIHIVVKSNLAFKNKSGHRFLVGFEGGRMEEINYNKNVNEDHPYDILYPTVASRVIETTAKFDSKDMTSNVLVLKPLDPGIVFEKIIVDYGGWKRNYLFN